MAINRIRPHKELVLLGLLVFVLCFSGYLLMSNNLNERSTDIELKSKANSEIELDPVNKPKLATTYTSNLTVNNAAANDWDWAVTQSWCSGSGTVGDPYLIDGHTIYFNNSLRGEFAAINISNSRGVYFKISNCLLRNNATDYGIGIALSNCTNGAIDTVTASNNGDDGIYIINSNNITIDDSTMNSNHHYGLNMDNVTVSTITTSTMNLNTGGGGYLINSTYNIFQTNCNFNNNTNGLTFIDSDLNNVTLCNFYNNTNYGIEILNSDSCIIITSDIEDNLDIGVLIYEEGGNSQNNTIYANDFDTNTNFNAQDNGTLNIWDNSVDSGNEWDDYPGADLDDDGIGDDPYDISGSASAQDRYPVWDDGDSIAPAITIVAPTASQAFKDAPTFSLTIVEVVGIFNRWYTLNAGTNNVTFTGLTGTISGTEWGRYLGLPGTSRSITIIFYANDTSGNIGLASVSVTKSFLNPSEEYGEDDETVYTYALSQNQIFILAGFAFALSLILRFSIIRGKKR